MTTLAIGQAATLACLMEVTAPKPGNVHRGADFEDATYFDFATSAVAIGPAMQDATVNGVGQAVLSAVVATRQVTRTNTNLGTILLLAPLAAVSPERPLSSVGHVLAGLTPRDAQCVYEAIRLANPGGLGQAEQHDIREAPPPDLLTAMRAAADRDLVARQYAGGFALILQTLVPRLSEAISKGFSLSQAIVYVYLRQLADHPDSLIARKCGPAVAQQASDRAATVLAQGEPGDAAYFQACGDFDFWLRSDHHRRNPGTTADLLAATLFAALREGHIGMPLDFG